MFVVVVVVALMRVGAVGVVAGTAAPSAAPADRMDAAAHVESGAQSDGVGGGRCSAWPETGGCRSGLNSSSRRDCCDCCDCRRRGCTTNTVAFWLFTARTVCDDHRWAAVNTDTFGEQEAVKVAEAVLC
jgi:hypothetical protein